MQPSEPMMRLMAKAPSEFFKDIQPLLEAYLDAVPPDIKEYIISTGKDRDFYLFVSRAFVDCLNFPHIDLTLVPGLILRVSLSGAKAIATDKRFRKWDLHRIADSMNYSTTGIKTRKVWESKKTDLGDEF